jgi:hypothetical protein
MKYFAIAGRIMAARIHAIQNCARVPPSQPIDRGPGSVAHGYLPAYEPLLPGQTGQVELPIQTPFDRSGLSVEQIAKGFAQKTYLSSQLEMPGGFPRSDLIAINTS